MKPHKANGKVAKQARVDSANKRHADIEARFGYRNGALDNKDTGTYTGKKSNTKRTLQTTD
jgi:hypothetical protein